MEPLDPLEKLHKDVIKAASNLNIKEVRYLVDLYYQIQDFRIAAAGQIRSMAKEEPAEALRWVFGSMEAIEKTIHKVMDRYTKDEPTGVGAWACSITGIGPIISAGLLAHIDITRAPTVGHIWRFAGIDPTLKWEKGKKRPFNAKLKRLCCHPDSIVTTKRGHIPISQVRIGDEVLTHQGRFRKVSRVFVNDFDGTLVRLNLHGAKNSGAWVTGNHPVYAMRQKTCLYRSEGRDRYKKATQWNPKITEAHIQQIVKRRAAGDKLKTIAGDLGVSEAVVSLLARGLHQKRSRKGMEAGWARAEAIEAGWLGFVPTIPTGDFQPELNFEIDGMIEHDNYSVAAEGVYKGFAHPNSLPIPKRILVDKRVGRLIGLYLAEGHVSGNIVGWSFHKNETEYQSFVVDTLRDVFAIEATPTFNDPNNSCQVIASRKALAIVFSSMFGKGAHEKRLPDEWMDSKIEITREIVQGLFEGDGDNHGHLGIVSEKLARQAVDILRRDGYPCSLTKFTPEGSSVVWHVTVGGAQKGGAEKKIDTTGSWYTFRKPEAMPYCGPVYNLEVEDDHTYVVEGIAVHNCWIAGESFVKFQNLKSDTYGKIFAQRKRGEWLHNLSGLLADQAKAKLEKFNIGKTTEAYQFYAGCYTLPAGKTIAQLIEQAMGDSAEFKKELIRGEPGSGIAMLPPGHIHARARRFSVKLFLAHWHEVAYIKHYGTKPPLPYPIAILGHAHKIEPPNL